MERARGIKPRNLDLKEVYVWELPVRIYHWLNALCIVVLSVTGYFMGDPLTAGGHLEASQIYTFGWFRFIHFVFAFIFFFNFLFRLYWGFVGNKYARWYNYIPLKKWQWREIWCVLKVDILHIKHSNVESVGHNSMASFSYFITFLIFLMQSLTGFGMYAAMSDSWFPKLFAWIVPLLGGDLMTRHIHHILMWAFLLFTIIHIYLVFYHDYIERRGITSSMIGGWKFIEKDYIDKPGSGCQ